MWDDEETIVPSTVAWELIRYNMPVDLSQFCDTFQCGMTITRECFAHLGLKNQAFEGQYDEIFGEGEFAKRRATYLRASLTANPYRVKDTARKRDYDT